MKKIYIIMILEIDFESDHLLRLRLTTEARRT